MYFIGINKQISAESLPVKVKTPNRKFNPVSKSTRAKRIREEFTKKDILTLNEIYSILSQDMELEVLTPIMKHSVRSSMYSMKKSGKIELIDKATYKIIK